VRAGGGLSVLGQGQGAGFYRAKPTLLECKTMGYVTY